MLQISLKQSRCETSSLIREIASKTGIAPLAARVMIRRGITSAQQAEAFLRADTFYDPLLLDGMEQAVQTIRDAADSGQRITVYGDYDCDGTCACAILYTAFKNAGIPVDVYIPDRRTEGYGLNENAVRSIAENGGLLITVDCGITNIKEVALARSLGLNVIVTDHHKPLDILPDCICIDPVMGDRYPCPVLSGAGTALKLVHALWGETAMRPLLDFAAIATVADLVPLEDENRAIVKAGLARIMENRRVGLMALIKTCGYGNKQPTAGQIAFGIGPRINAAGRMGHARRAFSLFTTQDEEEAERIACELNEQNSLRQRQEQEMLKTACALLEKELFTKRTAVVAHKGWHAGVIGIVASRLVDIYHRPAAVITIDEHGVCTGSARSIKGVDLFRALDGCSAYFTRYGGHEMAGGFSLPVEKLEGFREAFERYFQTQYPPELWARHVQCDLSVQPGDVTLELANDLAKLAPFGIGNPAPTLLMEKTKLTAKANLGKTGAHLRLMMEKDGHRAEGLLFRAGHYDVPAVDTTCDFVGTLEPDSYRGVVRARYLIRAIRLSRSTVVELLRQAGGVFGYGFAKCCTETYDHLPLIEADARIQASPYGLRLHVHTPNALENALAYWNDDASMALLEPYLATMGDATRGQNALIIAPNGDEGPPYPHVFRLDSDRDMRDYAHALFLERHAMGRIYRQLMHAARRPMNINRRCRMIADAVGLMVDSVGAAIAVFEQLGLLRMEPMVLHIQDVKQKKELMSSAIYRALRQTAGRDDNDAEKRCVHAR